MRATNTERVRELESAISIREREIAELEEQKQALQSQMVVATPALREDPLLAAFPVLDYCGKKPNKSILSIPVEQVGNTVIQFDIANKAILQENKQDQVIISELRRRINEQEVAHRKWSSKATKLADEAGIHPKYITEKSRDALVNMQNCENEVSVDELQVRKKLIEKELRVAQVITHQKGNTIKELGKVIESRRSLIDEIDELYNRIRVVDRDIAVETEALEFTKADHSEVEECLEVKRIAGESPTCMVIEQDVEEIKTEKEVTVAEQRIPQERVVKAQDYRLAQLESRLKAVDKALVSNRLKKDVEKIVSQSWSYNTIDVPESKDELYDIERIIPAQEKVHPGIYNLFLTEKDRSARTVSVLNIVTKEKEEVIAALSCKLEALASECNLAIQELDEMASGATQAEEQQRSQALVYVRQQRESYNRLYQEVQHLRAQWKEQQC